MTSSFAVVLPHPHAVLQFDVYSTRKRSSPGPLSRTCVRGLQMDDNGAAAEPSQPVLESKPILLQEADQLMASMSDGPRNSNRAGLFRTPISGGVQSATLAHRLPDPAVAVRNLMEQGRADVDAAKVGAIRQMWKMDGQQRFSSKTPLATLLNIIAIPCFSGAAHAVIYDQQVTQIYGDLGAGLEIGLQVMYLAALLCLVGVASYFVVKQVLIRRDLESAARDLQDRVRTGEALPVEYFELGAVMLRKRFFTLASRYLEQAIDKWDGDPQELAQVHNALGFSYMNDENIDEGIAEYQRAVKLQPGYTVAWNNLGNAYEKKKELSKALEAYEQALKFDPNNATAKEYRDALTERVKRLKGVSLK